MKRCLICREKTNGGVLSDVICGPCWNKTPHDTLMELEKAYKERQAALWTIEQILDSFPSEKLLRDLEADAGPGYRKYSTAAFPDSFIHEARKALEVLKNG